MRPLVFVGVAGLISGMIVVRLAGGIRRLQAHAGRIAEQENTAQVIGDHRHPKRQPELIAGDEHTEREGQDDAAVAGHRGPSLAHAGQQSALHERRGGVGELQAKSRGASRATGGGRRGRGRRHGNGRRVERIRKLLEEFPGDRIRIEADRSRIGADERAAEDARRPPRDIAALERLEQPRTDFRVGRDGRQQDLSPLAFVAQARAQGHCRRSIVWRHWRCDSKCKFSSGAVRHTPPGDAHGLATDGYRQKVGIAR